MAENRVCVIMQPTYLPWLGYFDLIDQSTVFVFLDDVQFSKQSWQQRNRIRTDKGLGWLTVPVRTKGRHGQLIREVEIRRSNSFPKDHIRTIEQAYSKSLFFKTYFPRLRELLSVEESSLCRLNISFIQWLANELGIKSGLEVTFALRAEGKRSELLADICLRVGANVYLSPMGSAEYLTAEHQAFEKHNIEILFHNFSHPTYCQVYRPFMPQASAIDLLFNEGARSLEIIRSGRRHSFTLEEIMRQRCFTKSEYFTDKANHACSSCQPSIMMKEEKY